MKRDEIYKEVTEERDYQDRKWGGPAHDDKHTSHDWIAYIIKYVGTAVHWPFGIDLFRQNMIKVAALAVAAVEWADRLKAKKNGRLP